MGAGSHLRLVLGRRLLGVARSTHQIGNQLAYTFRDLLPEPLHRPPRQRCPADHAEDATNDAPDGATSTDLRRLAILTLLTASGLLGSGSHRVAAR